MHRLQLVPRSRLQIRKSNLLPVAKRDPGCSRAVPAAYGRAFRAARRRCSLSAALPKAPTASVFVYGTLMEESSLYQITGQRFPTFPAYLEDFKKVFSHFGYPYIVPSNGSRVDGLLIRGIDADSSKRLDKYEDAGRLYFRKQVTAICGDEKCACEVYVGNEKFLRPRS